MVQESIVDQDDHSFDRVSQLSAATGLPAEGVLRTALGLFWLLHRIQKDGANLAVVRDGQIVRELDQLAVREEPDR